MLHTSTALQRPVTTVMTFIALVLVGLISLRLLPLEEFPDVTFPGMQVIIPYPGSTPEEVEQLITRPVEEALSTLAGIEELRSRSEAEQATFQIAFDWGRDIDAAAFDVRTKLDSIRAELPAGADRILAFSFNASDQPVVVVRISADQDLTDQYDALERYLKRPLERVPGVARVELQGVAPREVRILINAGRMAAHSIDVQRLATLLQKSNFSVSAGEITEQGQRFSIRPIGEFRSLDDIRNLRVTSSVRLADIADVELVAPELEIGRHLDNRPAVGLDVFKTTQANVVEVVDAALKEIERAKTLPQLQGISIIVIGNQAESIRNSLGDLRDAGLIGLVLAIAVLFFFLRDWSMTAIVALAVPGSLLITLAALYFLGLTLNIFSMMGMMLAIGMLVDNAVVITESVFRHRQLDPRRSAGRHAARRKRGRRRDARRHAGDDHRVRAAGVRLAERDHDPDEARRGADRDRDGRLAPGRADDHPDAERAHRRAAGDRQRLVRRPPAGPLRRRLALGAGQSAQDRHRAARHHRFARRAVRDQGAEGRPVPAGRGSRPVPRLSHQGHAPARAGRASREPDRSVPDRQPGALRHQERLLALRHGQRADLAAADAEGRSPRSCQGRDAVDRRRDAGDPHRRAELPVRPAGTGQGLQPAAVGRLDRAALRPVVRGVATARRGPRPRRRALRGAQRRRAGPHRRRSRPRGAAEPDVGDDRSHRRGGHARRSTARAAHRRARSDDALAVPCVGSTGDRRSRLAADLAAGRLDRRPRHRRDVPRRAGRPRDRAHQPPHVGRHRGQSHRGHDARRDQEGRRADHEELPAAAGLHAGSSDAAPSRTTRPCRRC